MLFSTILLLVVVGIAYRVAPHRRQEDELVHGAGQIGLLAAVALFGVDYFTSYFYATGEMMSVLHPYGLQHYGYIAVAVIALGNLVFGALYMVSLGVFNQGGGSYTAAMRYLSPSLSLIVAVALVQDYIFTIVVSALSGGDQLLSILRAYGAGWFWHLAIGVSLASITWFLTIRGRSESARVVFTFLGIFGFLTVAMLVGLLIARLRGVPPVPMAQPPQPVTLAQAAYHLLTAAMKGMVALTGLEAMSDGIQFVVDEDVSLVKWGKERLPRLHKLWDFYSGKSGIGRIVQTSFLFYGGLTTLMLTAFAIRFNVFDGTLGRTLVGNLAFIGFAQLPGGILLFWAYQSLAVVLLAAASMTAFQDLQASGWRDAAIGEFPEALVNRNRAGTFTRSVTAGFVIAVVIMLLVRGRTTLAVPYYGVGVFLPITIMGLAMRQHALRHFSGRARSVAVAAATFAAGLGALVFVGQIVGKWTEGGWLVLISVSVLIIAAHLAVLAPPGRRQPAQIEHIVRDKAEVKGAMGSIVEWQSLKMQEYRYTVLKALAQFFALFGLRRSAFHEPAPVSPGEYDEAVQTDNSEGESFVQRRLRMEARRDQHSDNPPHIPVESS